MRYIKCPDCLTPEAMEVEYGMDKEGITVIIKTPCKECGVKMTFKEFKKKIEGGIDSEKIIRFLEKSEGKTLNCYDSYENVARKYLAIKTKDNIKECFLELLEKFDGDCFDCYTKDYDEILKVNGL